MGGLGPDVLVMPLVSEFLVHPPLWFQRIKIIHPRFGIVESIRNKQGKIFKSFVEPYNVTRRKM